MYLGKAKCKALKEIRRQIAEKNDIAYAVSECSHQGDCKGTCPKCEAEVAYLERELEKRRGLGKKVCLTGVSLGVALAMNACTVKIPVVTGAKPTTTQGPDVDYAGGLTCDSEEDIAGGETQAPDPAELDGDISIADPDDEISNSEDGGK